MEKSSRRSPTRRRSDRAPRLHAAQAEATDPMGRHGGRAAARRRGGEQEAGDLQRVNRRQPREQKKGAANGREVTTSERLATTDALEKQEPQTATGGTRSRRTRRAATDCTGAGPSDGASGQRAKGGRRPRRTRRPAVETSAAPPRGDVDPHPGPPSLSTVSISNKNPPMEFRSSPPRDSSHRRSRRTERANAKAGKRDSRNAKTRQKATQQAVVTSPAADSQEGVLDGNSGAFKQAEADEKAGNSKAKRDRLATQRTRQGSTKLEAVATVAATSSQDADTVVDGPQLEAPPEKKGKEETKGRNDQNHRRQSRRDRHGIHERINMKLTVPHCVSV
eukprot:COSAG05_NODE_60_length_23142_cov_25.372130_2_plen_335_part_00